MAKMKDPSKEVKLWTGIEESDFTNENNIDDEEIGPYDLEKMKIFSANINYFRQILRLSDSLKPVERRILYSMYLSGAKPGTKTQKCNTLVGNTMTYHAHGDSSIYKSLVGMAQVWKRAVPLIKGSGNFGNDAFPESYAHSRYTEALMSKYAYECFFSDYDEDCVETIFNTAADGYEPLSLPSKFPNILINGGAGIAIGNSFMIPPFNVYDIIDLSKKLIVNPEYPNVFMLPDMPSNCQIIDDGHCLKDICDKGKGVLRMRSNIEVIDGGKYWILKVSSIPWMASLTTIRDSLIELTKKGILPIKETQDCSYQIVDRNTSDVRMAIDFRILFDKAHDPYVMRAKLYKVTDFEKSLAVNFKVVLDVMEIGELNLRELILAWIDGRREYKRRLLNKKITRIQSRISILEILIYLLDGDHIEKTVSIIKNNNLADIVDQLRKYGNMSSFQATRIAEMKLNAFSKDARQRYLNEKENLEKELEYIMDLIKSEKKIDKIIMDELDDLKKYGSPRKSEIVSADSGRKIAETDHIILTTQFGQIKKLHIHKNTSKAPAFGSFKNGDYPTNILHINNMKNIMMFDSLGKYSIFPVHEIENTEASSNGVSVYDTTKMNGTIVSMFEEFNPKTEEFVKNHIDDNMYFVTLTKNGFLKKTPLSEYATEKSIRNAKALTMKSNDKLVYANIILDSSNVMIYTKKGMYAFIAAKDIIIQSKISMGLVSIDMDPDDECVGMNVIGKDDRYILVITEKGNAKKCEVEFMATAGKRMATSYITKTEPGNDVIYVDGIKDNDDIFVCSRQSYLTYKTEDIPTLSRRAKCPKVIPVPLGNNIISITIK